MDGSKTGGYILVRLIWAISSSQLHKHILFLKYCTLVHSSHCTFFLCITFCISHLSHRKGLYLSTTHSRLSKLPQLLEILINFPNYHICFFLWSNPMPFHKMHQVITGTLIIPWKGNKNVIKDWRWWILSPFHIRMECNIQAEGDFVNCFIDKERRGEGGRGKKITLKM